MKHMTKLLKVSLVLLLVGLICPITEARSASKPLKVYILAGQSNMQGQARLYTVPRMALSPESKGLYDKILDESGKPREHKNVSIVYFTAGDEKRGVKRPLVEKKGLLKAAATRSIGPELGFGVTMDEYVDEPILIIKTAWGGKDLNYDFRSPSAGIRPFVPPKKGRNRKPMSDEELKKKKAEFEAGNGAYYRLMMKLIKSVLADPSKYSAAYDPEQGYEIAGFAWLQGYNDQFYYPGSYDHYTKNMAHFIRDVRKELKAPNMPFAIGVIGVGGNNNIRPKGLELRKCMAAPASMPEFKGNVVAVETACFWDDEMLAALKKTRKASGLWGSSEYWTPVGTPAPADRVWSYTSFELAAEKQYRKLREGEKGDERTLTGELPESLKGWLDADFDTSKWKKGPAPIGKEKSETSTKKKRNKEQEERRKQMIRSPWGEGNMLLMKTTFEYKGSDTVNFRLRGRSTASFFVYLNGRLIVNYPWWHHEKLRTWDLGPELSKYIKQGTNELAVYGNILQHKGQLFNAVDFYLEGLPQAKAEEIRKQQDAIATPRDRALSKGCSNQPYHYMGSAYTYSLIGEALAKGLIQLNGGK